MKFITLFYKTQYNVDQFDWQPICNTDATDFVFIPPAYTFAYSADYSKNTAAKINQLVADRTCGTTNIWIGTPGIDMNNFASGYTTKKLTDFLAAVYAGLTSTAKSKVAGGYMNQEAFYEDMDYNNLLNGSKPANKQLKIMSEVGAFVKKGLIDGTKFLWIPYYGIGNNATKIIKDLGHAADKVQIFDYCIMQPGYLRNPSGAKGNFEGIRTNMKKGKVCYRDGVPVIASKVSDTKLGFEMEFETGRAANYPPYVQAFAADRNTYPYGFYWAGTPATVFPDVINKFILHGTYDG